MHFNFALLAFLPLVYSDSIKVNSPTGNQVFKNASFLVDYVIERNNNNDGLFLTNTTTQLLDTKDNVLVSFPKDLTSSPSVRLNMITFVKENTVTNFTLKIIGFGKYNTSVNGKLTDEIETKIPLQLNLNGNSTSTTSTSTLGSTTSSSTTSSTSSTPTVTSNSTLTNSSIPTTTTTTNVSSNGNILNAPTVVISLLSVFFFLF